MTYLDQYRSFLQGWKSGEIEMEGMSFDKSIQFDVVFINKGKNWYELITRALISYFSKEKVELMDAYDKGLEEYNRYLDSGKPMMNVKGYAHVWPKGFNARAFYKDLPNIAKSIPEPSKSIDIMEYTNELNKLIQHNPYAIKGAIKMLALTNRTLINKHSFVKCGPTTLKALRLLGYKVKDSENAIKDIADKLGSDVPNPLLLHHESHLCYWMKYRKAQAKALEKKLSSIPKGTQLSIWDFA